jgi:hypothetical protein
MARIETVERVSIRTRSSNIRIYIWERITGRHLRGNAIPSRPLFRLAFLLEASVQKLCL